MKSMSVFSLNPVGNRRLGSRGRVHPGFVADGLTLVDLELLLLPLLRGAATEGENWGRSGERSQSS